MKYAVAILSTAAIVAFSSWRAAGADGQGVSEHFWYPGDNGKLSQRDCSVRASAALTVAGFHHVSSSGAENNSVVYADKGIYQAAVFCLLDNGSVTFVVMGPDQSTTSTLAHKFDEAWRAE